MTQYKIDSGLVFENKSGKWEQVAFYPTPNQGGQIKPKYFVIHFTAGRLDAHGTAQYFQKPEAKASAHLNLSEDGTLTQNVSLEKKAWHAGKSSWGGVSNLNDHSIGIEVCNPGPLEKTSGGWKAWFGKIYNNPDIIEAPHPNKPNGPVYGWIPFTEQQIEVLLNLGRVIVDEYDILETVGHDMISPGRKTDPGPCMSTNIYRLLNETSRDNVDVSDKNKWDWYVSPDVSSLNGRAGPGTTYETIVELQPGQMLDEVLDRKGVWWEVETEDGKIVWVHSKFLRTQKLDKRM